MKHAAFVVAASILAIAVPASADMRVVAGNGLTLTEAAQAKFNRDSAPGDAHEKVERVTPSGDYARLAASFGMTPEEAQDLSLAQVFVAKVNHGASANEQMLMKGTGTTLSTRSPYGDSGRSRLAASAGLTPAEASRMSLTEIAAAKFANDDR